LLIGFVKMTEKTPEMDQDGKMINPHNPDFITKVPWYLGSSGPTLKHHSIQKNDHFLTLSESDELVNRKIIAQREAAKTSSKTTYKKGACKNCGATTHNEKDCVERPRSAKKAAWKSGLDIAPDEITLDLEKFGKVSYSTKRDQYKGYNPADYQEVIEKHQRVENERSKQRVELKETKRKDEEERKQKSKEDKEKKKQASAMALLLANNEESNGIDLTTGIEKSNTSTVDRGVSGAKVQSDGSDSGTGSDSDSDYGSDDDDSEGEDGRGGNDEKDFLARDEEARTFQGTMAPQGGLGGAGMRQTVRDLRLREDTPKYLRNLALDSAFYDPKSRSMRNNPLPNVNPEDLAFAGDNFIRHTGDALKLAQNQVLCWEMQARGESIDVLSNPSQAEMVQKQFVERKKDLESTKRKAVLAAYTDGVPNAQMDPRLRLGQTETYVEYGKDGRIIKGSGSAKQQSVVRTKYEEDVFTNNHSAVWGSYYNRLRSTWGYQCCHSLLRNSYCTGQKGREANDTANNQGIDAFQARKMLDKKATINAEKKTSVLANRNDIFGESSSVAASSLDAEKLKEAHKRAEEFQRRDHHNDADDRKRGYNSMQNVDVTLEDMEVYRLNKSKGDDPMAAFAEVEETEHEPNSLSQHKKRR
jgi:pre-mRNA-processing factor SLU7